MRKLFLLVFSLLAQPVLGTTAATTLSWPRPLTSISVVNVEFSERWRQPVLYEHIVQRLRAAGIATSGTPTHTLTVFTQLKQMPHVNDGASVLVWFQLSEPVTISKGRAGALRHFPLVVWQRWSLVPIPPSVNGPTDELYNSSFIGAVQSLTDELVQSAKETPPAQLEPPEECPAPPVAPGA